MKMLMCPECRLLRDALLRHSTHYSVETPAGSCSFDMQGSIFGYVHTIFVALRGQYGNF